MDPIRPIPFSVEEIDISKSRSIHMDHPGPKVSSVEAQKKLEEIFQAIQEEVGVKDIKLDYSVNKPTGQIVVKVIDGKSGKLLRQIPPSELLALAESMKEFEGILLDANI